MEVRSNIPIRKNLDGMKINLEDEIQRKPRKQVDKQ